MLLGFKSEYSGIQVCDCFSSLFCVAAQFYYGNGCSSHNSDDDDDYDDDDDDDIGTITTPQLAYEIQRRMKGMTFLY